MTSARVVDLESLQSALVELLDVVDRAASASGARYVCAYGTALGAVRHGNLIPWDTDCDVVVPAPDLVTLIRELESSTAGTSAVVRTTGNDPSYDHLFPRVALRDVDHNLVHVDLFPLVGTFVRPTAARVHLFVAKVVRTAFMLKRCSPAERYAHAPRRRRIARIINAVLKVVPAAALIWTFERLSTLRPLDGRRPTLNLGGSYGDREVVEEGVYFPAGSASIAGLTVRVPQQVGPYLTQMYGEYETLPSEQSREDAVSFFVSITLPKIMRCQERESPHAW